MKITKAGVSYTLIINFPQPDLQAVQIAAKAVNIRNGIYAEAYDAVNNKMNTHYGFYIQSDKVEEQEKKIELFFYALRMTEEELKNMTSERDFWEKD